MTSFWSTVAFPSGPFRDTVGFASDVFGTMAQLELGVARRRTGSENARDLELTALTATMPVTGIPEDQHHSTASANVVVFCNR